MKKHFLFIIVTSLYSHFMTAQVLYNETFDNYTLGNLGTDTSGVVPGQGGWITDVFSFKGSGNKDNSRFTIINETNKGKVLTLSSTTPPQAINMTVKQTNISTYINQRTSGNNVIKLEMDYYTGSQYTFINPGTGNGYAHEINLSYDPSSINSSKALISYLFRPQSGGIGISYYDGTKKVNDLRINNIPGSTPTIPFNTWIKFNIYLDYNNKKVYFETPYFNAVAVGDFLSQSTSSNLMNDFKPSVWSYKFSVPDDITNTNQIINKIDNIKITALQNVPPEVLSTNTFLSQKFNLFPNPASHVVNIDNSGNMTVNKVDVYDVTGKLINTQKFSNETEIQLNVETLNSGTYLLHLHTNEGIAVKKLIKK